jgi:chromosome partitioning protein
MRVLVHTQKGGVGKTTTVVNLGAALLRLGHAQRVLLADLDPQQHLTAMVVTQEPQSGAQGPLPVCGEPGLFLVSGASCATGDPFGRARDVNATWTIVDTAPGWSPRIAEACTRADLILCPLEPDFLGLSGVGRMLDQFGTHELESDRLRFLLTRFNPRLALHREVRDRLNARFGGKLLPHEIRNSIKLAEAPGMGRTIFAHAPASTGSSDYSALATVLAQARKSGRTAA